MSRTAPLLVEIGCEEIPARMIADASRDLAQIVTALLDGAAVPHGPARPYATPRRLSVIVDDVAPRQADRDEEITGPPVKAAHGPDGQPTKAAVGFAQKLGLEVSALSVVSTPKGDYLGIRRHVPGRATPDLVAEELPRAVAGMFFPKSMRWGDGSRRFVRPVHWVVAMLGGDVVPLELFGQRAGNATRGHRILGDARVIVPAASDYPSILLGQGVSVDRAERRRMLSRRLVELAGEDGVRPVENEDLLEEVADLVEYPGAVLGTFPIEFLSLPREILVTTLKHHQKAFSTETDEGLANRFLVVADRDRDAEGHIRRGNEWVVVGRLEDARFFFNEDRKVPFANRRSKLANITFHARAGSYADKSDRIEAIAMTLTELADRAKTGDTNLEALRHAAQLCKCDLTTGLVGEFAELQGVAGGIYTRLEGPLHPPGAADAIYDHYRPAGAGDDVPRTREGALLALADKLDTVAALGRCIGLPTGSKDPFALRRAASTAIRIVAESPLTLSLSEMVEAAWRALPEARVASEPPAAASARSGPRAGKESSPPVAAADLAAFLRERLEFWMKEKGARYDTVNAVLLAAGGARALAEPVPRLVEKVFALERIRELPDSAALVEIHKRCRNILAQSAEAAGAQKAAAAAKHDPAEAPTLTELASSVGQAETAVGSAVAADDFEGALQSLVRLRPALTRFFDHVLVMHPDAESRRERLGLVQRTARMIEDVADLKQISISRDDLQSLLARLEESPRTANDATRT